MIKLKLTDVVSDATIIDWYTYEHDIHPMDMINWELDGLCAEDILRMREEGWFTLEDDFFTYESGVGLYSMPLDEVVEKINAMSEAELAKLEAYIAGGRKYVKN